VAKTLQQAGMVSVEKIVDYFPRRLENIGSFPLVNTYRFLVEHLTPYLS
jgi:hypothetical protein